jgi:hypothetical protein
MTGEGTTAKRLSGRSLRWAALVTGVVVVMATLAAESARSPGRPRRIGIQAAAPAQAPSVVSVTTTIPQPPLCQPPPKPANTYPTRDPSYGVGFVAQLTAELKGGYDLSLGARHVDPWRAIISNINGWAAGLLQVPALTAQVTMLKFCYQGLKPPLGIIVALLTPNQPATTNVGHCIGSSSTPGFLNMQVTLVPDPTRPTTLAVTGVESDGTLDLTGTQSVSTQIFDSQCPGESQPETCFQFAPTQLTFSTRLSPPPQTAPPGVVYPFSPRSLRGPIDQATATMVGNSFPVPAFKDTTHPDGCGLSFALNASLAGFDTTGTTRYSFAQPQAVIAGDPGWNQFQVLTQVNKLG